MRKPSFFFALLLLAPMFASAAIAQEQTTAPETPRAGDPPSRFYHFEFVVQELGADGKPTNTRTYVTTLSTQNNKSASIRTNSRVPIVTGSTTTSDKPNALVNTQFQYVDVGVNIDASRAHEVGRQLAFDISADISSVAEGREPLLRQPIIRQNKWQAVVLIPTGKSTVLFTSDALDSKGSMQLSVTAAAIQ
ncbi:hypothetical protein [Occallatibacter savannae]|uniref:hypothetical protein n=1 Tax=Occallatibacter savannae TaxID=1002691 RepID=UPI000D69BD16|nr:hypothetical protein [Occallatibacter savannae]